jgi:hypothetical protein
MRFICGDRFVEMSDFVYTIDNPDDYYKHPNTFSKEAVEAFSGIPIIYTLTSNAESLLKELAKVNKKVVLITHSSDTPVNKTLYDMMPETVVKWFSQNAFHDGEKLHGIPIGIENAQRQEFHHQDKPKKILAKAEEEKTYKNLCYLNCSTWTYRTEREECYRQLQWKPWVTTVMNINIFDFDGYIDNIYRHKFVACPRGNGIDTHRTWETLYLDSIPIERPNPSNAFWRDLPICFVQNWNEVTADFLTREYDRIMSAEWNLDKLFFPYWEKLIKSYTV